MNYRTAELWNAFRRSRNDIRRRPSIWWARHIDVALDWLKIHGVRRRAATRKR